jgi:hypothetical protein
VVIPGALAKFGESNVAGLAELNAGGDKEAVDIDAGLPLEFKQHVNNSVVRRAPAKNPSAAAGDCAGKSANQA